MAQQSRYNGYSRSGQQRPQQRTSAETHSSYEEALRRSNERMDRVQRSSRRMSDQQQSLRYSDDDPRAQRYLRSDYDEGSARASSVERYAQQGRAAARADARQQRSSAAAQRDADGQGGRYAQQTRSPRKTVRLGSSFEDQDLYQGGYAQQDARAQRGAYSQQGGYGQQRYQQRGYGAASQQQQQDSAPYDTYREQQLASHSRHSQAYHARPATFSTTAPAPAVSSRGFLIRAVICVVLVIFCVFSITRIGPAFSARGAAEDLVAQQQAALDEANAANAELQSQIDERSATIDAYNVVAQQ